MRTIFDSTQSQESKSEVCSHEFYAAMRIKAHLDNALYLSQLSICLHIPGEIVVFSIKLLIYLF